MASGLRQLAAETGFSIATISRALNDSPAVTPATKQLVKEAAERLGYVPSPAARALATRRTRTIGAVVATLEHSIFSSFIHAIENTLADLGYALVLATSENDTEREHRRALDLMNMGAEGLIVSGLVHANALIEAAEARNVPLVCTSIYDRHAALPTIGYDNQALGGEAAQYLMRLGHRDIAVMHGPADDNDRTRLRMTGARDALAEGARARFIETGLSVGEGAAATRTLLGLASAPSAILCLSDVLALGVLFQAPALGVRVPDDLSVMGFDNLEWAASANPPLTTIALPVGDMGRQAASALARHLDEHTPIEGARLEAKIIERASTRAIEGRSI